MTDDTERVSPEQTGDKGVSRRSFLKTTGHALQAARRLEKLAPIVYSQSGKNIPAELPPEMMASAAEEAAKPPDEQFRDFCLSTPSHALKRFFDLVESISRTDPANKLSARNLGNTFGAYISTEEVRNYNYCKSRFDAALSSPASAEIARRAFPNGFMSLQDFLEYRVKIFTAMEGPHERQALLESIARQTIDKVASASLELEKPMDYWRDSISEEKTRPIGRVNCPDKM